MAKKVSHEEKVERNRELVQKRVKDPITWSWGELAKTYNMSRAAAQDMFNRHATKYVSEREIANYRRKIQETYAYVQ